MIATKNTYRIATTAIGAVLLFSACGERRSSATAGWASEVPSDAIRFIKQEHLANTTTTPAPKSDKTSSKNKTSSEEATNLEKGQKSSGTDVVEKAQEKPTWVSKITEPTTITLWHSYRATERTALKAVIDEFHALGTPIKVKVRAVPFDAFNDKIKIVVPEGRGPDLFIFAHDLVGAWSEMGIIEPLSNWTTSEDLKPFLPSTVKALVYRNALYGMPLAFKCVALFYNKDLVSEPPSTFEELVATAKSLTTKDRFGLVYEAANLYFHAPWLHAYGGAVLDEKDDPIINTEATLKAASLASALVREHEVTPMSVNTGMVSGYFNDGKAAMVINGPWMRGELAPSLKYGVAPLPSVEGNTAQPYLGVEAVYMNRQSQKKQAAIEVMRWLVSKASAQTRFTVGKQPVANKAVWADTQIARDEQMDGFLEQSKAAIPMPSSPRMQQIWTPYNSALLAIISGGRAPKKEFKIAQRQAAKSIRRAKGGK
jgi:arabinogalactan oligomer/maltooligosaccharide transport system substrate-binding protein